MSNLINFFRRSVSTSSVNYGKRNFRKFPLYSKRGSRIFKERQSKNPDPEMPVHKRGMRDVGYLDGGKYVVIPEKIPEIIVPDLSNCTLKPYVSYKTPDIHQSEFTAQDLFNVVYAPKILKDYKEGKLDENGKPLEPSEQEKITAEEARLKARQTGTDIF